MTTTPTEDKPRRTRRPSKEIIALDAPRTIHTRPVQQEIPQFEQKKINEIERAADKYVEKRDLRMGLGREEADAKALLSRVMHDNADAIDREGDTLAYNRGDYKILVTTSEKLKVKIGEEPDEDEGEDF